MGDLQWRCQRFDELSLDQLYAILQFRAEVFVVEQDCAYQDIDDYDRQALHVCGEHAAELLCYCRLLPPGSRYPTPSVGRVISRTAVRGQGLGRQAMLAAMNYCEQHWPGQAITISAQQ